MKRKIVTIEGILDDASAVLLKLCKTLFERHGNCQIHEALIYGYMGRKGYGEDVCERLISDFCGKADYDSEYTPKLNSTCLTIEGETYFTIMEIPELKTVSLGRE